MVINMLIPFAVILLALLWATFDTIKQDRIKSYFQKSGYERYIIGVPAFGNGVFYGWKKDNTIVDDRNIKGMSLKEIKRKYK